MVGIRVDGVSKVYGVEGGVIEALRGVDLLVPPGSFAVVVGPSGCGKTTLLRVVAGLEKPTKGRVSFVGKPRSPFLPVAVVFQEPRLMPWLSVWENVALPLRGRTGGGELRRRVESALELVGLRGFELLMPRELSGGMAQRVALARALAVDPDVVLLDEPMASLDYFSRRRLQGELEALNLGTGKTFLMVTHDVEEAVFLADLLLVMEAGRIASRLKVSIPKPRDADSELILAFRREVIANLKVSAGLAVSPD